MNENTKLWTKWTSIICFMLVVAGLLLRLQLMQQGILQDEAVTVLLALQPNVHDLLELGKQCDYNPPALTLFLHYLLPVVGATALNAKLPSLICWVGLVPCVYILGTICHSRQVGLLAAACAVFSRQSVFYATMARPYSLATLLACILLVFFMLSLQQPLKRKRWLICTSVTATVLVWSHYTGPIYIFLLSMCVGILWLARKQPIVPYIVAFAIPTLLYLPWLPTMLEQSHAGCPWYAGTPLSMFPFVVTQNLSTYIPLPNGLAFSVSLLIIVAAACLMAGAAFSARLRERAGQTLTDRSTPLLVLCTTSIIPCMLMGYMTPFLVGLYRYIYPFDPAGWVLLSMLVYGSYSLTAERCQSKPLRIALVSTCALLVVFVVTLSGFAAHAISKHSLSGFRELVSDIKKGELQNTMLIIAPDQDIRSFEFDYHVETSPSPTVNEHRFYRWDLEPLLNRDADSPGWKQADLVPNFMQKIEQNASKYKFIAVTSPDYCPSSPGMPARQKVDELLAALRTKYGAPVREKYYDAGQEQFRLYLFKIEK